MIVIGLTMPSMFFIEEGIKMSARELTVFVSVIMIVAMLIIPLPTWLLSILLIMNISLAFLVLLTSMNLTEPLQFSVFPTLLLLVNFVSFRA